MQEVPISSARARSTLDELCDLYRALRYDLVEWVSDSSRVTTTPVVEGIGNFARLGVRPKTLAFDLFELVQELRSLRVACTASFRSAEQELPARFASLEAKLEELLAPLDRSYVEKLLRLLKVYAYAYRASDYPPESYLTYLYRELLTAPTPKLYEYIQQAARKLAGSLELMPGQAWREEQAMVAAALNELEVQFLLSDPAELTRAVGD